MLTITKFLSAVIPSLAYGTCIRNKQTWILTHLLVVVEKPGKVNVAVLQYHVDQALFPENLRTGDGGEGVEMNASRQRQGHGRHKS